MENITKKSFVKKLAGYSTLAVAGLAVEPAMAGVIYSGPGFSPVTIAPGEIKPISFGGSLGSLFQFNGYTRGSTYNSAVIQRGPNALPTQSVAIPFGNDPQRFGLGYLINAGLFWINATTGTGNDVAGASAGRWNDYSNPGTAVRGYLGIRFNLLDGMHYGFFDVGYDNTPSYRYGTMTVYGWAYENTPELGILTGPTGSSQVPEPATALPLGIGLLALGAAGIRAKRKAATSAQAV